jgi:hypothetical protein
MKQKCISHNLKSNVFFEIESSMYDVTLSLKVVYSQGNRRFFKHAYNSNSLQAIQTMISISLSSLSQQPSESNQTNKLGYKLVNIRDIHGIKSHSCFLLYIFFNVKIFSPVHLVDMLNKLWIFTELILSLVSIQNCNINTNNKSNQ